MATGTARIRRASKDSSSPYKSMSRALFEDSTLSFEARGVMGYILVKPDDWNVRITDLRNAGGIGRDKTYRIIDELITAGYIKRVTERREDGTIGDTTYFVYEEPCPDKPDTDKPESVKPESENKEHTKEEELLSKKSTKKECSKPSAACSSKRPSPPPLLGGAIQDTLLSEEPTNKKQVPPTPGAHQEMFGMVLEMFGMDPKIAPKGELAGIGKAVKTWREAGYTPKDLRVVRDVLWPADWRGAKGERIKRLRTIREMLPDAKGKRELPSRDGVGWGFNTGEQW